MRSFVLQVLVCVLTAIAAPAQIIVGGGSSGQPTGIPAGATVWYGAGAPASNVGANGDYYFNTSSYCLYGPMAGGAWPTTCVTSVQQLGYIAENAGAKGTAGGYAPLDGNALVPAANLPAIAAVNGTSVPSNNASDQTVVTTAPSIGAWTALPSCPDTLGNHLNYNVATHGFLCGNTGSSVGSVSFGGVAAGTNANALLIGGSLTYTGGGQVNANQLGGVTLAGLSTGLLKVTTGTGAPSVAASSDITKTLGFTPENTANKGAGSGYAGLDSSGHLASSQMPALTGDVSSSGVSATVSGLQGRAVANTAPASNQVLQWNGSQWSPGNPGGGSVSSVFGRTGAVTGGSGDYSFAQISGVAAPSQLPGAASWSGTLGNFTIGPGAGGSGNGSNNVAVGYGNLTANTTGYQNIGIGQSALAANTTGNQNVAIGSLAMLANTTGSYNTAVGENALGYNTTGYDNFAFGLRALYQNTTGYNNSAFGIDSVGINTTGYRNSGFGVDSCAWNVTGYENSCMGMNTLWSLTTGYDNAGMGFNAMFGATSGHYLTGLGAYADLYYPNTMSGVTLTPTSNTANLSVGWYWYKVSYVLNGQETALSNNSYLGVLTNAAQKEVTMTGLPSYSGPFTASARRIYRTPVCPTTLCTVITANQAPRQWYYVATITDNTTTTYVDSTADASLGPQESSTPGNSIALGAYATVYGSYQMVVGSDASPIQQIWLGNGMVTAMAPAGVQVSSSGASGTNVAGQDIILSGGPGTGSASGGNVIFGTVPGGNSGSTWNSLTKRWKIDSATGNLVSLSSGGISGVTGAVDFSGSAHSLPAKVGPGASKPSTCSVGEQYFASDAAAGQNLFGCTTANTWTLETGGGGGSISSVFGRTGSVSAAANDYNLSQIASGTLTATSGAIYNPAGTGNTQIVFKNSSSQAGNGVGSVLWQNNAGSTMSFINWDGGFAEGDGTNYKISLDTNTLGMSSDSLVAWHSLNNVFSGTADTGLARESAGVVKVTNGSSGYGTLDTGGLSINGTPLATALAGDVTGAFGVTTVAKIQGQAVSSTAPASGQVLQWTGSQWAPGTLSGAVPSVFGRSGAVTAQSGDYTLTQITSGTLSAAGGTVYNSAASGNTQIVFKNSSSQAGNGAGSVLWQNNAGSTMSFINWDGGFAEGDGTNYKISLDTNTLGMSSDSLVAWHSLNNVFSGTADTGLARESAGVVKVTNGSSGYGTLDTGGLSINGTPLATALAGDVTGAFGVTTVAKIQGQAVSSAAPASGQVLQWTGSQWAPGTLSGAVPSVFGRSGAVTAQSGDYALTQIGSGTLSATGGTVYNSAAGGNTQIVFKNSSSQVGNGAGPVLWQNNAGTTMAYINWDGGFIEGDGTNYKISLDTATLGMSSDSLVAWRSANNVLSGTADTGLARESAGILKVTNGSSGYGTLDAGGLTINGTPLATVLAGDVTGAFGVSTVAKIQGQAVSSTAPTSGQVLQWNGSQWVPTNPSGGGAVNSIFGRTGAVTSQSGDYSYAQISGTLPDAALPSDAVTAATLSNSTLTAALTSLTTTSGVTAGGSLTAAGNVYANSGSTSAGCLHLADTNAVHDTGFCAPSAGVNQLWNLWTSVGTAGQAATTDGAGNLLWSNLSSIAGTLGSAQMPTLTGDVSNSGLATTVTALQGRAVASAAPNSGQSLAWNSSASQWQPTSPLITSVFGRSGVVTTQSGDYTLTQIGAGTLSATGGTIYNNAAGQNTQIVVQNGPGQATSSTASVLWKNNAGSNIAFINWDGGYAEGDGTNYKISLDTATLGMSSDSLVAWHSVNNVFLGTSDTGLARESAGIVKVTNGASGYGAVDAGGYSASGAAGVTSSTCTQWTNGLCTHN